MRKVIGSVLVGLGVVAQFAASRGRAGASYGSASSGASGASGPPRPSLPVRSMPPPSDAVKELQRRINSLGGSIKFDGWWGPETEGAYNAFREDQQWPPAVELRGTAKVGNVWHPVNEAAIRSALAST